MKSLKLAIAYSALLAIPALAGGGHGQGHDDEKNPHSANGKSDHVMEQAHNETVGSPAQPSVAQKIVLVSLTDQMRINLSEDLSTIKSGSVIQFVVTNEGRIPHEFSIGNQAEQQEHAEMMRNMPGMTHADGNTITVEPGATKTLTWDFEGEATVVFACNIPGHYEAGMFQKANLIP
jgi:uncharacterized cupredoxin-like copper-binding protein